MQKTILKSYFIATSIFFLFFAFVSCKKNRIENDKPVDPVAKMVLVYVAANNNLEYDALESINKMEKGIKAVDGNLLVFIKTNSTNSYLLKIKHDNTDKIVSDTIKTYGTRNSSDPTFLSEIISDARQLSPAYSYSLVMWSHATSWAPPLNNFKTKSFGNDNGQEMDIRALRDAIPSDFEYIMFDACSMGSIEVVYELKDKAKYILASPSEVLSSSFPYETITPLLFGDIEALKTVGKEFINFYSSLSGNAASATVSLIKTSELETLSNLVRTFLQENSTKGDYNINSLQLLNFEKETRVTAFDFMSFFQQNFEAKQYASILNQIGKTVLYKNHTKSFFNVPINTFCGLSVYIPIKNDPFKNYYLNLKWSTSSGWNNLFN